VETFWQDVRYGLRMLGKNPGFASVAILTVALGIGANTAIFSLMDQIMLRSLPVMTVQNPEPDILRSSSRPDDNVWTDCHGRTQSFSYPVYNPSRDSTAVAGMVGLPKSAPWWPCVMSIGGTKSGLFRTNWCA